MPQPWSTVLDALMRERGRALFGYAYVLACSVVDAEDLVQSALIKTFSRGRPPESVPAAESYVRKTIRTLFIDDRRKVRHTLEQMGITADAAQPDASHGVDARLTLHKALLALPPRERACVVLRFFDDMTMDAIADELNLAPGSVRKYVSQGVKRLESRLGELGLNADDVFNGGMEYSTVTPTKGQS